MKHLYSILALCILMTAAFDLAAQRPVRLNNKDLKKMSTVKLVKGEREFPRTMLYKTSRQSITVLRETPDFATGEINYLPTTVDIDEFDHITIYNKKRKIWGQVIGGVGLGATAYFVTDQLYTNRLDSPFLEILNQQPEHRFIEPIVAAILGSAVGVILGDMLSPVRIDVKKDKKAAYEKLKRYSYR